MDDWRVMLRDKIISPEWWIKLFSVLAVVGIVVVLAGGRLKNKVMVVVGAVLCVPLVLGSVGMFAVGIASLIIDKWKNRNGPNR